jgi:streptomycin 3"-adenylyltransferase
MYYQTVIDNFSSMSQAMIGENLIGIYLHGSMAMGCFNPNKSDIDLLVVIDDNLSDMQKMEFMKQVVRLNEEAPAKGLELSIVKREYCNPVVYPTPFELHFSPMHLQWFRDNPQHYVEHMKGEDKDLVAHFTIIHRYGSVLYGEAIETVFGEVPQKDYMDSIWYDVESAREDIINEPVSVTLNLCRVLAFVKEDLCLSKQQGGEWGILHIDVKYRELISQAISCYTSKDIMVLEKELLFEFAEEMLLSITSKKGQ